MPNLFILDVETDVNQATLRLSDGTASYLAAQQVCLPDHPASLWAGLFDMRNHVRRYAGRLRPTPDADPLSAEHIIDRIGVFLGRDVLGRDIIEHLYEGVFSRTLIIRLPDPKDELAAAFARMPWEIARPAAGTEALFERNLAVRAMTASDIPEDREIPLALDADETLRVLLIFAQAPDSIPLAVRLERERLLAMFHDTILPQRDVQVDVLCHGVTRAAIAGQVTQARGYHIVHWSGHGHHDWLELLGEETGLNSTELVNLFRDAGGFIPTLMFLSAWHSGSLISPPDWNAWKEAALQEDEVKQDPQEQTNLDEVVEQRQGYTGTALELLKVGVQQVVAMRYAVGDAYARRLARRFYKHVLAEGHATDAALSITSGELVRDPRSAAEYAAVDHATPLLFGRDKLLIQPHARRSPQLKRWQPQPRQPLLEGDLKRPDNFVGRTRELTRLHQEWLVPQTSPFAVSAANKTVGGALALIQGLAGLGKTALAAEAIHLWHQHFDYVLAFQARSYELKAEKFYQESDMRLTLASKQYRDTGREDDYCKVFLPKDEFPDNSVRLQKMRDNLIDALHNERILLVIDNFETNLLPDAACKEPEWAHLLSDLATRLTGSGSRVLITSRHRPTELNFSVRPDPSVLSGAEGSGRTVGSCVWLPIGPLPVSEARLFIQSHAGLHDLWYTPLTRPLAIRALEISRGHPLILTRLGSLASDIAALKAALDRLETEGYKHLPDLVVGARSDAEREEEGGEGVAAEQYMQAHWQLGRKALDTGDGAIALKYFESGVSFPESLGEIPYEMRAIHLLYFTGLAYEASGQTENARQAFENVLAIQDMLEVSSVAYYQALALFKLDKAEEARQTLDTLLVKASELAASEPNPYSYFDAGLPSPVFDDDLKLLNTIHGSYLIGLARLGLEQKTDARQAFEKVLTFDPDHLGAREELKRL